MLKGASRNYVLVYVCCLWLAAGCTQNESTSSSGQPVELSLHFDEKLVIEEKELSPGDFLVLPVSRLTSHGNSQIRTDSEGNIYVPDHSSVTIRVFDSEGNFLHNIGREGSGPGEFTNIGAIDVFQDTLVVYDLGNLRLVRFTTSGNTLPILVPEGESNLFPLDLHQLDEERYLFLRKRHDFEETESRAASYSYSNILHLYDTNHSYPHLSFGDSDSLMDASSNFVKHYTHSLNAGRIWLEEEGGLWFAPGIYDGRLFKFQEGNDGWEGVQTLEGYRVPGESVELDAEGEGTIQIVVYAPRSETFSGRVRSQSLGLFTMQDGRLVHISSQVNSGERQTFVEAFNAKGQLEGVGQLSEFTFPETDRIVPIRPFWKDRHDQFYFLDDSGETPVLRIGRIQGLI